MRLWITRVGKCIEKFEYLNISDRMYRGIFTLENCLAVSD
jgi:hypothetical protein